MSDPRSLVHSAYAALSAVRLSVCTQFVLLLFLTPPLIHVLFGVSISLFSLTFFLICLQGSDTKIFTFLFDLTQSSVPKIPMLQKISQFFVLEVCWIVVDTWNCRIDENSVENCW